MKKFFTNNAKNIFLSFCIIFFVAFSIGSALHESLTFDEIVYLQEGRQILLNQTFYIDPYNPPFLKELAVLPYLLTINLYQDPLFHIHFSLAAKIVITIFGIGVLFLTYGLTKKYIGETEALFAVALLSGEPTFLANSHLVTLDIGLTFFFLIAYGLFLSLLKKKTLSVISFFTIGMGLGLATKLSFIPFFLFSAFSVIVYTYKKLVFQKIWDKKKSIGLVLLSSLFIVWMVYWFRISPIIKARQDNTRLSQKIIHFSALHHVPFLGQFVLSAENQGVPLGDFLAIIKNTALRQPAASCFFLGSYYASCLPYFLPINLFLKVPFPLIVFVITSFLLFATDKQYRKKTMPFILPLIVVIGVGSLSRIQPLVRYILPAYPFVIIFAATCLPFWQKNLALKILFVGLCFWYIGSTLSAYPHFLSYANEFSGYQNQRFLFFTDSNLDWGQALPDVSMFVKNKKPSLISLSYFGRDNGDWYGLQSDKQYMSYKNPDICAFHTIRFRQSNESRYTAISSSNWYSCGYYEEKQFAKEKIKGILGDTILIF